MKKPYIVIHSLISMDGKLQGNFMKLPEETAAAPLFKHIGFSGEVFPHAAHLNGTSTCELDYTYGKAPHLDENAALVPDGDFVCDKNAEAYIIALDRKGRLGWTQNFVPYAGVKQHIIAVLTNAASNSYKAFLRKLGISYVICGDTEIDLEILCDKLVTLFSIENVTVGGGGKVNWSFIRSGLVDEVSMVIAPCADGKTSTPQFFSAVEGEDIPAAFTIIECMADEKSGAVWLRYKLKKAWKREEYIEAFGLGPKDFISEDNSGR